MRTKILFYIFSIILILSSCIERIPPEPPGITIAQDSILEISILKPVKYDIEVHSNEELIGFVLTSNPPVFKKDTSFAKFSHDVSFSFVLNLPFITAGLPDDSIITLTMEVSDKYNKTKATRFLKVIQGYPAIIIRTIKLESVPEGQLFYSFSADSLFYISDNSFEFTELAFYLHSTLHYVLCSPDSKWLNDQLIEFYPYDNTIMLHTRLQRLYSDWDEIDAEYLYEFAITEGFINGSPSLGVGADNLINEDILGFELTDGRKGAIQVFQRTKSGNSISLNIKIQEHAL
jgi:hypothetical protein